ncbi:MAG: hypothetical protein V3S82_05790 [Dehalococcoidia bacterium]
MQQSRDGSRQRNLIVLLMAVAIVAMGYFAAVKIVSKGKADFQTRELNIVQTAVVHLMADNDISRIPNPVTSPTNDMTAFPDTTASTEAKGFQEGDKPGYLLYAHDKTPDGTAEHLFYYVNFSETTWTYAATGDGTVIQGEKAKD